MKRNLVLFLMLVASLPARAQEGLRVGTAVPSARVSPEIAFQRPALLPVKTMGPETTIVATIIRRFPERAVMVEGWQPVSVARDSHRWETAAAAGVMVPSGILAAILKDRANREFSNYNSTLNPNALDASRRLDSQSDAVFVVTQVSFAILSYLLLSE